MRSFLITLLLFVISSVTSFTISPLVTEPRQSNRLSSPISSIRTNKSILCASPATIEKKEVSKKKDVKKKSENSNSKGWAVRLFNDPMNKREFVARCLTEVCNLSDGKAYQVMMQAHQNGIAVIGLYHLEMAELYKDQLRERGLAIDMIPVDDA